MLAGFMGAFASQFWFLAFALTAAANVRTLALVEVLFAQAVAYYSFKQALSARELSGHRADRGGAWRCWWRCECTTVMAGLVPGIHVFLKSRKKGVDGRVKPTAVWHGPCLKERTALILLVSSWLRIIWTRRGINTVRQQNIVFHGLLKHIPWSILDRLVDQHSADWDGRVVKTKAHLIAMLYAQFCGARSLREIETNLQSHAGKLYHLGGCTISRSALSTANASRPVEVFTGLLSALMAQLQAGYRRKIGDCVRLIDFDQRATERPERRLGDVFGGSLRRQSTHHLRS